MQVYQSKGQNYTIPQIDLSVMPDGTPENMRYLYEMTTIDEGNGYLGHPDSVLLKNGDILTFYPEGHGRGKTCAKISKDGGKSYVNALENSPESWKNSLETPTVYRLEFTEHDWEDRLILICGEPEWPDSNGGFDCSISADEGKTWTEYESFYTKHGPITYYTVVAMSSLTKLKENGKFVDKWMGLFHTSEFVNYKTILTFDENGKMHWSEPEPYFRMYRDIEKSANMCEVECIRSEKGQGDELLLLARSNAKNINSLISYSSDEGKTWSQPFEAPAALNGERHKADYLPDGRLFITFRSIERDPIKVAKYYEKKTWDWYSEGWIAWVGSYEDLREGKEGDFRIKITHTYLNSQTEPGITADGDTGYCGNVVLPDGTVVTSSYGVFSSEDKGHFDTPKGPMTRKTYVASKRLRMEDVEKLLLDRN